MRKILHLAPEMLADLVEREIEALDRLVDEHLARNPKKKAPKRAGKEGLREVAAV
jgi:hypothetical protein